MDAHKVEIGTLLAGSQQFVIPVFQRYYSWDEGRWSALWNDILNVNNQIDSKSQHIIHFIGPFIIIDRSRPHTLSHYLVIDGQQRLITLTVLLCALRDRALSLGLTDLAQAIETNSITFYDPTGSKKAKIVPRIRDRDSLMGIIFKTSNVLNEESLLVKAYKYFIGQIEKLSEIQGSIWGPKPVDALQNLFVTITQRLRLVEIILDENDNPSNVYESLNFKGNKLTDADLIRNHIFMQIPLEKQDSFDSSIWRSFESTFTKEDGLDSELLTDFYYRYLIAKSGYFAKNRLYVKFMEYLRQNVSEIDGASNKKSESVAEDKLEQFIAELKRYARFYKNIISATASEKELCQTFARFNRLDLDTALPFVMALYSRYAAEDSKGRITLSEFVTMLQAVESFVIRRSILRMRTRGYGLDFAQAVVNAKSFDELNNFLLSKGWPTDQEIKNVLPKFPIYHHISKTAHLILSEIERSFGHKESVDLEKLQIEHILPQTMTAAWRAELVENASDVHGRLVHTIGNLTLTGYNADMQNQAFEKKRIVYLSSNVQLNAYFKSISSWNANEIQERSNVLTNEFIKIWVRPTNSSDEDSFVVDAKAYEQASLFN